MGTTAAFFIGTGNEAIFLGGQYHDGYPEDKNGNGIPITILTAMTGRGFKKMVGQHMGTVSLKDKMNELSWSQARGIQYIYVFLSDHVWITSGGRWFNPRIRLVPPKTLPPPPVLRMGFLEGNIRVICGECLYSETIKIEKFDIEHPQGWSISDIRVSFESRGFKKTKSQGWLCRNCTTV